MAHSPDLERLVDLCLSTSAHQAPPAAYPRDFPINGVADHDFAPRQLDKAG
ncbi:hypothetical protein ABT168_27930 [Streptomyces sp. NPDC001793]|uniref:hypothetical protein n=1 Tax=Streptomyces sp. NPDC001793 TaxID=3154657 RepID=UPI003317B043